MVMVVCFCCTTSCSTLSSSGTHFCPLCTVCAEIVYDHRMNTTDPNYKPYTTGHLSLTLVGHHSTKLTCWLLNLLTLVLSHLYSHTHTCTGTGTHSGTCTGNDRSAAYGKVEAGRGARESGSSCCFDCLYTLHNTALHHYATQTSRFTCASYMIHTRFTYRRRGMGISRQTRRTILSLANLTPTARRAIRAW